MIHRTNLSTTLLIAIKKNTGRTLRNQPAVAGVKIKMPIPAAREKSMHSVDGEGNIVRAMLIPEGA